MVTTTEAPQISREVPQHSGISSETEAIETQPVQGRPTGRQETQLTSPPVVIPPSNPMLVMDKARFACGLLLSSAGIGCLLIIAIGALQQADLVERFSMPIVAGAAMMGIMMLGGGFGLMATAAAGLDDGEFEWLLEAGNISAAETSGFSRGPEENMVVADSVPDGVKHVEAHIDTKPPEAPKNGNREAG
jgi:hypothetical protein